jgi:hypothetical protein
MQKMSCQCGFFLYTGTSHKVKSIDPFSAKDSGVFPDHLAERGKERDESIARLRD